MTDVMIAGASPDFQEAAPAADAAGDSLFGAALTAVPDLFDEDKRAAAGAQYDAARSHAFLLDTAVARQNREVEAYDQAIDRVKGVTGVGLENPLSGGYWRDVLAEAQASGATPEELRTQWPAQRVHERAMAIFDQKLAELRARNPYYSEAPELRFDLNAAQAGVGRDAERAVAAADAARTGNRLLDWGAGFAGGTMGAAKTPEFWAGTLLTAPIGGEGGLLLRTGKVALAGGVANAAITAADQPIVQADRAAIGIDSGFGQAADNVKNSFLAGAVGAGAFHLAGEGASALVQALRRRAPAGSGAAEAVRGADVAAAASDLTLQKPAGVAPDAAQTTFAEALDAAHEPGSPAPLGTRPVPEGLDDAPARAAIAGAGSPLDQATRLRADPGLVDSALSSEDPQLRAAGAIADLGEPAWQRVRSGEIPADQAAIVALSADDPNLQSALITVLKEGNAQDVAAARAQISDYLAASTARERSVAAVGGDSSMTVSPAEFERRLAERVRALDPELSDKVGRLDAALAQTRQTLAELDGKRQAILTPANPMLAPHIAMYEQELAGITGKRRTSPRAKFLRAEIDRLRGAIDATAGQALDRAASDEVMLRLRLAELTNERGRLGPRVNAARSQALAEAEAIGIRPGEAEVPKKPSQDPVGVSSPPAQAENAAVGQGVSPEIPQETAALSIETAPETAPGLVEAFAKGMREAESSREAVPWIDDEGVTRMLSRDSIGAIGNRDEQLSFFISTCGAGVA